MSRSSAMTTRSTSSTCAGFGNPHSGGPPHRPQPPEPEAQLVPTGAGQVHQPPLEALSPRRVLNVAASAEPLEGVVDRDAGDGLSVVQVFRDDATRAAAGSDREDQRVPEPDAGLIFDLEAGDDVAGRDALDTPGRVRVDDTPRLRIPARSSQSARNRCAATSSLVPRIDVVGIDEDVRIDERSIARATRHASPRSARPDGIPGPGVRAHVAGPARRRRPRLPGSRSTGRAVR